jgi:Ca2+-transporting ATPase
VPPESTVVLAGQPWLSEAGAVAEGLVTTPSIGLTEDDAAARLSRNGANRLVAKVPTPAWRRLLEEFVDPLVFLLIAAVAISLLTWALEGAEGVPFEALVIGVILVANAVLGYLQEVRAEQAVAALQRMAAATSTVVRDGQETRVPATDIVPGDILVLAEGDAVSADARLLEASSLSVAEAALTGESEPVLKDASTLAGDVSLGDRVNMVFSGTAVTRGRGRAVVTATGMGTEMGHIAGLLGETEEDDTPLQREIARVGRTLGLRHPRRLRPRGCALGRRLPRGGGRARGVAGGAVRCARPWCAADGGQARHREEALIGGDAGVGVGDLLGQDGHLDP